ncbi:hypothetical protein D3C72_1830070 [compost metagenome]
MVDDQAVENQAQCVVFHGEEPQAGFVHGVGARGALAFDADTKRTAVGRDVIARRIERQAGDAQGIVRHQTNQRAALPHLQRLAVQHQHFQIADVAVFRVWRGLHQRHRHEQHVRVGRPGLARYREGRADVRVRQRHDGVALR